MICAGVLSRSKTAVGIIGSVTAFIHRPTIREIYQKKSVEEYKPDPYLAAIMNCCLWIFYGLPVVHPHSIPVITTNAMGLAIELVYISILFFYANKKLRLKMLMWTAAELVFMTIVVACTLTLFHTTHKRSTIVGILCAIFCAVMYISPLTVMGKVIKTRSVKYMPFWLSLANVANTVVWTLYALASMDYFILIPNVLGILAGVAQLALYAYYRAEEDEGTNPTEIITSSA